MRNPVLIAAVAFAGLGAHVARRLVVDPKTRRIRRGLLVSGGALAGLLSVHAVLAHRSTAQVEEALAAIRAKKEPLASIELAPPPCSPDENVATLANQALALTTYERDEDVEQVELFRALVDEGKPLEPAARAATERWVKSNDEAFARLEKALDSGRPRCRFELDYAPDMEVLLPHLMPAKQIAQALAARAVLEADAGSPDRALATVALARRVPHLLDEEPFLISYLVRMAIANVGHDAFVHVLDRSEPSAAALAQYDAGIDATAAPAHALVRSFRAERSCAPFLFGLVRGGSPRLREFFGGATDVGAWLRVEGWSTWRANVDELAYLDVMTRFVEAARTLEDAALVAETVKLNEQATRSSATPITCLMVPALDRSAAKHVSSIARRRMEHAAVALRLHRIKTGSYPETLTEVSGAIDPFTGKPFGYKREGKGFVLECAGLAAAREKSFALELSR